ncbi:MAG: ABC-2 type transport system ATP-binding protein [Ignavibacteria bacterium]|nr:MAG: ABC-2 type transport system ATP-binding protein [Ignavibacteria bacterium]KAF0158559.1 MAG: ABC-2 type transport system ATP-binding protein [Ignavibacteria bacterium]
MYFQSNKVLEVKAIGKEYGKIKAVNGLSFHINKREIFALLGPNGAGKTTTVRMLMNIIKPDTGEIKYFLENSQEEFPKTELLGYLPEERGLYQDVKILKTLVFMGIVRGMDKTHAKKEAEMWLERFELSDRKNEKLNTLSKGNQQKVQLISAILHKPKFLILDEPFSGFDPINQEAVIEIMTDMKNDGTTILLSAHQMHLVEKIADRVLLMNSGASVAYGTVEELKRDVAVDEKIIIHFSDVPLLSVFENDDTVESVKQLSKNEIVIYLKNKESLSATLNKASSLYNITKVKTEDISLHEIFLKKLGVTAEQKL